MADFLGEQIELKDLGLTVRAITEPYALSHRYPDARGVVITGLRPGFPFEEARPRLRSGDVITRVGEREISVLEDARAAAAEIADAEEVVVAVRRDVEELLTVVEPAQDEPGASGGELPNAWLGVKSQVLTRQLAESLDIEGTRGFRVTQVLPWTEAAKAGLKAGDVITSLDGDELEAYRPRDSRELEQRIERLPIGEPIPFEVLRDGEERTIEVVMEPDPATAAEVDTAEQEELEFTVREVTFMDRVEHRWDEDQTGVVVTAAPTGGWASMSGLRIGDLIVQVDDATIDGLEDFEDALDEVLEEQPEVVRFFVRRGYRTSFVFIEPDWQSIQGETP